MTAALIVAAVCYFFVGLWWVAVSVDWTNGLQFHSTRLPLPPWNRLHILVATLAQIALIALFWPFYQRLPMPFYKGRADASSDPIEHGVGPVGPDRRGSSGGLPHP